jgi:hypothetical protein
MPNEDNTSKNFAEAQAPSNSAKEAWDKAPPFPIAENTRKFGSVVTAACQCKTQAEAAELYAKYGIPVIPCNWKLDEGSKFPLTGKGEGGVYFATTNLEQIRQWWKENPKALIGVPGGRRTGIWFVDADRKGDKDGVKAWFDLVAEHDPSSGVTRAHKTGTGGLHFLYLWDNGRFVGNPTLKGIGEIKGEGGYVIFPPSPYMLNGHEVRYSVSQDIDPEPAPEWLYDLIIGSRPKSNGPWTGGLYDWSEKWLKEKLDAFCEEVRTATIHHWDEADRKVHVFGEWVGSGAFDEQTAWEAFEKAARQNPTAPADYLSRTKEAFDNGLKGPKEPPKEARIKALPASQWLGERPIAAPPALIKGLFPQTGVAIIGGQSGTGKTFHAIHLATCLIPECNQTTYIDQYPIKRHGGVLYIVLEGKAAFPMRVMAAFEAMLGPLDFTGKHRFPFAWNTFEPNLYGDPKSDEALIRLVEREAKKMRADFGVDLVTLMIDTMGLAACYENEDRAAQVQLVISRLGRVSDATGALVLGVDHYGKDQGAGLRGSSAKRGHVETILACLGDIDKDNGDDGKLTNLRLKFEKIRDGEEGRVIPYRLKQVPWGRDEDGKEISTCLIQWEPQRPSRKKKSRGIGRPNKANPTLQMAIDEVGLPADVEVLKKAFYKHYGSDDKSANKAWHRALERRGLDVFSGKLDDMP